MKTAFAFILFLFYITLGATAVSALTDDAAPVFDKDAFAAAAGVKKELLIGMVDCVAMALKNNTEIQIRKIYPKVEDQNVRIEKSKFEPNLSFDLSTESNDDLSPLTLTGVNPTKTRTGIFNFGYDEKFVTGTTISLDFDNTRVSSNSLIDTYNPYFDSEASVTITQPLLKGFGIIVNKAGFLIAKNNKLKSDQNLLNEMMNVLTEVKKRYYGFQYTQEQYKVALASLERIQDLHDINKEKYLKGLASNVDLLGSESELAQTEEGVLAAEESMMAAEDNLKFITNLIDDVELWNARIVLLDKLAYEKHGVDLINSIEKAFEYRPDYAAAKIELKNKDISVIFYKNNVLPQLDLTGMYGLNGLGQQFSKDMGNMGSGNYQDWSVGVTFKMPLFSDKERGEYEKSKLDKVKALLDFKRLEQKIILEVRDASRKVDIKYRVLDASTKAKNAEEENYAAQETRFRAGLVSTLDMVIYYERVTKSQVNYVKSVIDYNIAVIELVKAEGMTLVNEDIRLEE